jgi:hypothetical protein
MTTRPSAAERYGMQYVSAIPDEVPPGKVLVHNIDAPSPLQPPNGLNGFRAWLAAPDASRQQRCDCGWAPELPGHYRPRHST